MKFVYNGLAFGLSETKIRDVISLRLLSHKGWVKYVDLEKEYGNYMPRRRPKIQDIC
jgi:hypothetical protein